MKCRYTPVDLRIRFRKNLKLNGVRLDGLYIHTYGTKKATIYLSKSLSVEKATETLIHEMVHFAFDFEHFQSDGEDPKKLLSKLEEGVCNSIARYGRRRMVRAWRLSGKR